MPRSGLLSKGTRKDFLRNDIPPCPHCLVVCDGCDIQVKAVEFQVCESTLDLALRSLFGFHSTPWYHYTPSTQSHNRVFSTKSIRCTSCSSGSEPPPTPTYVSP